MTFQSLQCGDFSREKNEIWCEKKKKKKKLQPNYKGTDVAELNAAVRFSQQCRGEMKGSVIWCKTGTLFSKRDCNYESIDPYLSGNGAAV